MHHIVDTTCKFVSEKTPIAIAYVSNVITATVQWVYELHPAFFDAAVMHANCTMNCARRYANNLWDLLVEYTPIAMEMSVDYIRWMTEVCQKYLTAGQFWVQNALR